MEEKRCWLCFSSSLSLKYWGPSSSTSYQPYTQNFTLHRFIFLSLVELKEMYSKSWQWWLPCYLSNTMSRHAFTSCTNKNIQISSKKQRSVTAAATVCNLTPEGKVYVCQPASVSLAIWLRVASSHLKSTYAPSVSDNSWPNYGF